MRFKILGLLVAAALVLPAAFGDQLGPGGTWNGTSFGTLFTPPLAEGEQFSAPIDLHVASPSYGNWVGAGFGVDYDASEVNFIGVTAAPGFLATSPGGAVATIWNPGGAMQQPPVSNVMPLANITFAALNTTTANNGDVDITFNGGPFGPFAIYGATPFAPWTTSIGPSNLLYVGFTAGGQPMTASQWGPVAQGEGTWIHATDWKEVVLLPSMWWGITAHLIGQGGIGVEHIPEPAAAILLFVGIGTFVVARRRGRA
ncbi:MAG: PEP-CTERM sorting domain-containing protein [Planctomycetota bacterium]